MEKKKKVSKQGYKKKQEKSINKLILKIDKNYDDKIEYMNKILPKSDLNIQIISKKENKISINDNKNNILLAGNFNFYGIYQPDTNLWIWASSIPGVSKQIIKNINKIKNLNYLFENDNSEMMNFYYQILTQDVIMIPESNLKFINKLLLYLSDDYMIYNPENQNNIQFIGLINIKEKYY